ncbi:MAG: cytidylate kinase-like family protein [Lachnospiraceae bacterium]|jgi:cytidylate kinase|nr:cytidylate kinase-like family protein [Lachnospiraceae bacterium]
MDEHIVISIGCEYACGGAAVGRAISKDLGIPCYDRVVIDRIMEQTGVSPALLSLADKGIDISGLRAESGYSGAPTKYTNLTDRMVYLQKEVVKKLAEKSSCIIIGRCSDYILRERDDCLNFFIYAPMDKRMENVKNELKVDDKKAAELIKENDENLHARYLQITGTDWGERHHRQILIDSSVLGVEGTAKYLEEFIELFRRKKYGK